MGRERKRERKNGGGRNIRIGSFPQLGKDSVIFRFHSNLNALTCIS